MHLFADCIIHIETGAATAICALLGTLGTALAGAITWVAVRVHNRLLQGDADYKGLVEKLIGLQKENVQTMASNSESLKANSAQTIQTHSATVKLFSLLRAIFKRLKVETPDVDADAG